MLSHVLISQVPLRRFCIMLCFFALLSIVYSRMNLESDLESYSFEEYQKVPGTEEYAQRSGLFQLNKLAVIAHNQDSTKTWKIALNKFSVLDRDELKGFRGAKLAGKKSKRHSKEAFAHSMDTDASWDINAPVNIDWRKRGVITPVKNQGNCGSCWTFGSAETLESYWKLATGNLVVLSEQQILDCTPNPNDCGGWGGCAGGTVELAYAQIQKMGGLSTEASYPYVSGGGNNQTCQMSQFKPVAKVAGFVNLPENQYQPILSYLANSGPLAISVDASTWSSYSSGVYDGCDQSSPDLDHIVQLVGAGTDPSLGDYWLVRNSWSPMWGESGYIRLKRSSATQCGIDTSPQDGDGCNGGPSQVTVCGTCGILYDALYPIVKA